VPAAWPGYKVTLRIEGAEYVIEIDNSSRSGCGVVSVAVNGTAAPDGRVHLEPGSGRHVVQVILGRALGQMLGVEHEPVDR
jgi:cellobiose phosphorylase